MVATERTSKRVVLDTDAVELERHEAKSLVHPSQVAAIRDVHALFEEQSGRPENRGKVPAIACTGSDAMKDKYGTNFRPRFELLKWVDRPAELADAFPVDDADVWKGAPSTPKPTQHVAPPAPKAAADPLAEALF